MLDDTHASLAIGNDRRAFEKLDDNLAVFANDRHLTAIMKNASVKIDYGDTFVGASIVTNLNDWLTTPNQSKKSQKQYIEVSPNIMGEYRTMSQKAIDRLSLDEQVAMDTAFIPVVAFRDALIDYVESDDVRRSVPDFVCVNRHMFEPDEHDKMQIYPNASCVAKLITLANESIPYILDVRIRTHSLTFTLKKGWKLTVAYNRYDPTSLVATELTQPHTEAYLTPCVVMNYNDDGITDMLTTLQASHDMHDMSVARRLAKRIASDVNDVVNEESD